MNRTACTLILLLRAADNDIALDSPALRSEHREVLRNYMHKYVVKRG